MASVTMLSMGWLAPRVTFVVLVLALVPVAVAASAAVFPPRGTQTLTLGCADTVYGQLTNPFSATGGNVVGGAIAWPVLRRFAASLPAARFRWHEHLGFAVKALAVVKAGTVVRVVIPPRERHRLSLYYILSDPRKQIGSGFVYRVGDGEREVTFRACPRSAATLPWSSQFPGYFIVHEPQCALIEIYTRAAGSPLKRQIPFGVPRSSCSAIP